MCFCHVSLTFCLTEKVSKNGMSGAKAVKKIIKITKNIRKIGEFN